MTTPRHTPRNRAHNRNPALAALAALMATTTIALSAPQAEAQDVAGFYSGREVKLVVGTGAGGAYDAYARVVARHLPRHVPGNPTFVVQHMPGASGVKAVNWLHAIAPKDGSVISTFNNAMPFYQAIEQPGIRFKTEELSWLGSLSQVANIIGVWHTTGVKTIADAKTKEITMGSSGAGGTMSTYPLLLNQTLGTRFKIVSGYEAGAAVDLAVERGEVQGRGSMPWTSVKALRPDWVTEKKIVPLVQVGLRREPDLPDVPLLTDLAQNDEQRRVFEFVSANIAMERPYAGPPGMQAERFAALRTAFAAMTKDKAFIAELKSRDMDFDPRDGEDVARIVKTIVSAPAAVIQLTKDVAHKAN